MDRRTFLQAMAGAGGGRRWQPPGAPRDRSPHPTRHQVAAAKPFDGGEGAVVELVGVEDSEVTGPW